jgi:hypothetical protein
MILLLVVAFGLTCATVILHALGTLAAIAHLVRLWQQRSQSQGRLASEVQIVRAVSILLLLHFAEAGIWAGAYRLFGLLPDMETAIYFSLTSYTTVGYGDVVLPAQWRLLGPIEAAVGILMFGWSTGIMVTVINRVYGDRLRLQAHPPTEGQGHE